MQRPIPPLVDTDPPRDAATFRVPISLRVYDAGRCCTVTAAERILREDFDEMQHAVLDGVPYGWTLHRGRPDDGGYATVHAVVRLTLTVPAQGGAPLATARALLEHDLNQLSEVDADLDSVTEIQPGTDSPRLRGRPSTHDDEADVGDPSEHRDRYERDNELDQEPEEEPDEEPANEQPDGRSWRTVTRRPSHARVAPDEVDMFDEHVADGARCSDACRA
jgi:hypothetical protein